MKAFAANIALLLNDRGAAQRMGQAAREQALERFRREKVVVLYEELYRRVLAQTR
jgi:glycosyltransferase involved in cell wall biosynthesis